MDANPPTLQDIKEYCDKFGLVLYSRTKLEKEFGKSALLYDTLVMAFYHPFDDLRDSRLEVAKCGECYVVTSTRSERIVSADQIRRAIEFRTPLHYDRLWYEQ